MMLRPPLPMTTADARASAVLLSRVLVCESWVLFLRKATTHTHLSMVLPLCSSGTQQPGSQAASAPPPLKGDSQQRVRDRALCET